ncbi:hypothetical protein LKE08_28645 [Lyngbya sp. CCY1209]|nr:hypothetical protein [Lyngbya sp. CCY1209]
MAGEGFAQGDRPIALSGAIVGFDQCHFSFQPGGVIGLGCGDGLQQCDRLPVLLLFEGSQPPFQGGRIGTAIGGGWHGRSLIQPSF